MFELRFFEIYRSEEFVNLLIEGILVSTGLTISAGIFGFIIAFILAAGADRVRERSRRVRDSL